jgi:NAD(P)-dependent dehydrogenase (short-subunit alcohol dehydrogenase family)
MTIVIERVVMKVQNSIAFVTGANGFLGLAIASELVARGAKTVYAGVRSPDGFEVPGLVPVRLDVTDPRPWGGSRPMQGRDGVGQQRRNRPAEFGLSIRR